MKAVEFPEPYRSQLAAGGGVFRSWGAPSGYEDEVYPAEACTYEVAVAKGEGGEVREGQVVTSMIIELTDEDLESIRETGMFEFGVWGAQVPVFFFTPLRKPTSNEIQAIPHRFIPEPGIDGEGVCSMCRLGVGHEMHTKDSQESG